MTQLGLAAGQEKPLDYLRSQVIDIADNTSLPGVAVALTEAMDNHSAPTAAIPTWANWLNAPSWML